MAWVAPSATVHAMTSSLAEATSGEPQPPPEDGRSEETPEIDTPRSDDDPPGDGVPEESDPSDDSASEEGDPPIEGPDSEIETPIEVMDSELEAPTEPGATDEPAKTSPPEVAVEDNGITAEAPRPPGNPSVSPPPVIAAQQSELPQTGIDADILTGIGASLTALGAAALRASKEPETERD